MNEFRFMGCYEIKELLGIRAEDEMKLMEFLEEVPLDCIYYHTHSYFLRHFYIAGPYPNDFANWAAIQVRDRVLGEKLAAVTCSGGKSLEDLRNELIEVIDSHLSEIKTVPAVTFGQPFHFMQSKIIEVPSGLCAATFPEFIHALTTVDASAIYNHVFEARLRDKLERSDFAIWLDEGLSMKELADKFEMVDSYMYSLEGLRERLLSLCQQMQNS